MAQYLWKCGDCAEAYANDGGHTPGLSCGYYRIDKDYVASVNGGKIPYLVPQNCPQCGTKMVLHGQKNKVQMAQFEKALNSEIPNYGIVVRQRGRMRPSRSKVKTYNEDSKFNEYGIKKSKQETDDESLRYKLEDDEGNYEPAKEFRPDMRYSADAYAPRKYDPTFIDTQKELDSKVTQIGKAVGRPVGTGIVMATAFKTTTGGVTPLSAYRWVNWTNKLFKRGKPYTVDKFQSHEWCHLVADSLGGATDATNLVAASYAANTFMLVIEQRLQAKTNHKVRIVAACSRDNLAEFISYTVIRPDGKEKAWEIDAHAASFSSKDGISYGKEVDDFLK